MKKESPIISLQEEILLQVDGEEEQQHTLSWELLKKIGDNTQTLIDILMKVSLQDNIIPAELTKLIFVGFYPGSAIPSWRLPNYPNLLFPVEKEIDQLNNDFSFVIGSLDSGNFQELADRYTEPSIKNLVVDAVYTFSNSVGTKPFRVVKRDASGSGFKEIAKIRKMTAEHKNKLYAKVSIENKGQEESAIELIARVKKYTSKEGKKKDKIVESYPEKEAALAMKIDHIETEKRIYLLKGEQTFSWMQPDTKSHVIENNLLDIYAFGNSFQEASADFYNQFDYTYQRLTNIEDAKLSKHLLEAKRFITLLVDDVKEK